MEKKVKLMKLLSLIVLSVSVGIAYVFSDIPKSFQWAYIFLFSAVGLLMRWVRTEVLDERELYVQHLAGWVAGVLVLVVAAGFIIWDIIKSGHYDNRFFILMFVWAVSNGVLIAVMGGGRGKVV
jgi:hypothetical protein